MGEEKERRILEIILRFGRLY